MFQTKKILAILLIATFLVSIPLSLLDNEPEITVIVNRIEIETGYGKPSGTPGGKPDRTDGGKPGDYKLMGVKWETLSLTLYVEDAKMVDAIWLSASEWDSNTIAALVTEVVTDNDITIFDEIESKTSDGRNELVMADLDQGVIAICYTWYDSITGEIIQFDIAFNTDYLWGDAEINPDLMDLQNIATHELGHGFGLADIYKRKLSDLTMYGYSGAGHIDKRTLEQGDIDGIQALYG